jgi:hypothetical protein
MTNNMHLTSAHQSRAYDLQRAAHQHRLVKQSMPASDTAKAVKASTWGITVPSIAGHRPTLHGVFRFA